MPCRQCEHPLEKGIHTCERGPFNTEMDYLRARVAELEAENARLRTAMHRYSEDEILNPKK